MSSTALIARLSWGLRGRTLVPGIPLTRREMRQREAVDADVAHLRNCRVEAMRVRLLTVCLPMMRQARVAARYSPRERRKALLRQARMGDVGESCTIFRPMMSSEEDQQQEL